MAKEGANITKKSVLITVDKNMHEWAKENINNFSGFVEKSLHDFSSSFATGSEQKV